VRACSPTSLPAGLASCAKLRSIACSFARMARVVIRPPAKGSTRRSAIISRALARASAGASAPVDCSSSTARSSPGSNVAARSVNRSSTRSSRGPGRRERPSDCPSCRSRPWPCRAAFSCHTLWRSSRVTGSLALRFSSFRRRSSPRSGALPHFARNRSAAAATSRLRAENASINPWGTPAISKYRPSLPVPPSIS
jgi:hypothetical protein